MNYFDLMIQLVLKNDKDIDEHLLTFYLRTNTLIVN